MGELSSGTGGIGGRLSALRDHLSDRRLDCGLISRPEDVHYFSGFSGSDSYLVIGHAGQWLVTDFRYAEEAEKTAPGFSVLVWKRRPAEFIGEFLGKRKFRAAGYSAGHMTVAGFSRLKAAFAGGKWMEIDSFVADLRSVKDASEAAAIRNALACSEKSLAAASRRWKPGLTELDVKLDLEWEMRRRGAEGAAFETIVAAGPNASLPHAHAGGGKLANGRPLLVDFGARVGRYNSDTTRTFWLGGVPRNWRVRYRTVLEAQRAAIAEVRGGASGKKPDAAARRVFAARKWGRLFGHGLGHGVGLEIHEQPVLGKRSASVLRPGQVVTVEPGLYFPGEGGIRIEDMVLVTPDGCEVLGTFPKDIDEIVIA